MNSCTRCGKSFSSKWNLQRHVSRLHLSNAAHGSLGHAGLGSMSDEKVSPHTPNLVGFGSRGDQTDEESDEDHPSASMMRRASEDDESGEDEICRSPKRRKMVDGPDRSVEATYDGGSANSSSDECDDCESDSDWSQDDYIPGGDGNASQGVGTSDVVEDTGVDADGARGCVDETPKRSQRSSWARWRAPENGLYVTWSTKRRMPFVVEHRGWLTSFLKPPYEWKQKILQASVSQLCAFREMANNVVNGHVPLHIRELKSVIRSKTLFRAIADDALSYRDLRRVLVSYRYPAIISLMVNALPTCIKSREVVSHVDDDDVDDGE